MHWKTKAAIQNVLGRLPAAAANPVYYRLQRTFGNLRRPTPLSRLQAGRDLVYRLHQFGRSVNSAVFLEIGTGHQMNLPLSLWLCGASQVITVDLNRYLQERLVMDDIAYMRQHPSHIRDLFSQTPGCEFFEERFLRLTRVNNLRELFSLTNIEYLAPADARRLALASSSIDYHISFTVLEHVPPVVIKQIFQEGQRLLRPDGLFVHCIDFTDHFAHSDEDVSSVNFLQFSDREWDRLAGNRYMYHNRLRVDEFQSLLSELNLGILALDAKVDEEALDLLSRGFPLAERFRGKDCRTNATAGAWLVASAGCKSPAPASGVYPAVLRVLTLY
jgi:SAM-dependent methyltransferase